MARAVLNPEELRVTRVPDNGEDKLERTHRDNGVGRRVPLNKTRLRQTQQPLHRLLVVVVEVVVVEVVVVEVVVVEVVVKEVEDVRRHGWGCLLCVCLWVL